MPRTLPAHPLGGAKYKRSMPETWVTDYSGDIGKTIGLNGFSMGSSRQVSGPKVSEIVLHEADELYFVANLFDADLLAGERGA